MIFINIYIKRNRFNIKYATLFIIILSVLGSGISISGAKAEELSYVDNLVKSAHQKELYSDKYWRILLHYKKNVLGVTRSLIDEKKFFLAEDGKFNPKSELEATLRAFFFKCEDEHLHSICRYPARFAWLREKLKFDETKLPVTQCKKVDNLLNIIKPKYASLIFPTSYMNNPASMFGHTLVTIENENRNKLLAHAVNYSAITDDSFSPLFAIRGIFGLYKGYYSILPYYKKALEYRNFDQRDIWEYRLNLTEDEVVRMIMHLLELEKVYSDYFFFDENCSYSLLFLLDAARPSLALTDNSGPWVIPIDTIREVKKSGLIEGVDFRPSKATMVKYIASLLSEKEQDFALSIVNGEEKPGAILKLNERIDKKIIICDLAKGYIQYKYMKNIVTAEGYARRFIKILKIRNELGKPDERPYIIPDPGLPEEGHRSNRLSIGGGIKGEDFFQEIRYRAAYHDLLDYESGYVPGSQIQFCNAVLRYYYGDQRVELKSLDFVDIISISAWDKFFKPTSWKIKAGLSKNRFSDEEDHLIFQLNPGAGIASEFRILGLCYVMIETDLNLGPELENNYSAGIGGSIGMLCNITDFWKIHTFSRNYYYGLGDRYKAFELAFTQRFKLTTNNSINIEFTWRNVFNFSKKEIILNWNLFF